MTQVQGILHELRGSPEGRRHDYQLRPHQQPWRTHIEAFSLMTLIGDPTGLSVLDVACGEGFYTRMLRQKGAARVTGVDLSNNVHRVREMNGRGGE